MEEFSLEKYLSTGVERIVKGIMKASLKNPKASLYMMKHAAQSAKARRLREEAEAAGEHIPPFLIASITNICNLHCKGCYARANDICGDDGVTQGLMTCDEWDKVFAQASEMGVEFILLAGGEPLVREDVLLAAGSHSDIIFPVFTNGTMLTEGYIKLFEKNRNLFPIISIEGNEEITDSRRGKGIYEAVDKVMQRLRASGIIFGVSVTVTKRNLEDVLGDEFVSGLAAKGAKGIIYVEYVPVDQAGEELAPGDEERARMESRLAELRSEGNPMILVSFPGDEKTSGGCLAAGRGFFHINPFGGAEPCPFSPYSDTNVKDVGLRAAMQSRLFRGLQTGGNLTREHTGGCTLFEQREEVEKLCAKANKI